MFDLFSELNSPLMLIFIVGFLAIVAVSVYYGVQAVRAFVPYWEDTRGTLYFFAIVGAGLFLIIFINSNLSALIDLFKNLLGFLPLILLSRESLLAFPTFGTLPKGYCKNRHRPDASVARGARNDTEVCSSE